MAALPWQALIQFVVSVGLAIVGLAFTGYLLRRAVAAANGQIGEASDEGPEEDTPEYAAYLQQRRRDSDGEYYQRARRRYSFGYDN